MTWSVDVEAICKFFGLSPVILLVGECFKICISFFWILISFSLVLGSGLVLEVLLNGDFSRLCGCLFGFNVFSLLKSIWDSFSVLMLLDLLEVVLALVLVLLVPCTTFAYAFGNPILCLVDCSVSSVFKFGFYFRSLNFLSCLCCSRCLVFASLLLMVSSMVWYSLSVIFFKCFCIFDVIFFYNSDFVKESYDVFNSCLRGF